MIYDYHRFAIIFPQMNYGREALNGFRQAISEIEAEIVYEKSYSPTTTTYAQTLDGLDDINPDIILIPDQANRAAQLAGQIRYKEVLEPFLLPRV